MKIFSSARQPLAIGALFLYVAVCPEGSGTISRLIAAIPVFILYVLACNPDLIQDNPDGTWRLKWK